MGIQDPIDQPTVAASAADAGERGGIEIEIGHARGGADLMTTDATGIGEEVATGMGAFGGDEGIGGDVGKDGAGDGIAWGFGIGPVEADEGIALGGAGVGEEEGVGALGEADGFAGEGVGGGEFSGEDFVAVEGQADFTGAFDVELVIRAEFDGDETGPGGGEGAGWEEGGSGVAGGNVELCVGPDDVVGGRTGGKGQGEALGAVGGMGGESGQREEKSDQTGHRRHRVETMHARWMVKEGAIIREWGRMPARVRSRGKWGRTGPRR